MQAGVFIGLGDYYQGSANISTFNSGVYWLNNFDNIYQSYGKSIDQFYYYTIIVIN